MIWDGWSSNFTKLRKIAFAIRLVVAGKMEVKQYLIDLAPIEGRENAETLVREFQHFLLYFGLAKLKSGENALSHSVHNPYLVEDVVLPTSISLPTSKLDIHSTLAFDPKFLGTNSDSCETMVKSHKNLGVVRQWCVLHALHNVVLPAVKKSSFFNFWYILLSIIKFIRRSSLVADILEDIQVILGLVEEYCLLLYSESRWNSNSWSKSSCALECS